MRLPEDTYNWGVYVNPAGIHLKTMDGSLGSPISHIMNRVSINMSPFRQMVLYGYSRAHRGGSWVPVDTRVSFFKSNHTTAIRYSQQQRFSEANEAMFIDISDINEQAYFRVMPQHTRDDASADGDVGFVISRIDFLT